MSWKLTKKLKETHLGSLAGFTRSTSTASILDANKDSSHGPSTRDEGPTTISIPSVAMESPSQAPVVKTPKQGILVVTMHEACGLSLPQQHQNTYSLQYHTTSPSTGNAMSNTGSTESTSSRTSAPFTNKSHRPQTSLGRGLRGIPTIHGRVSTKYMPYALVDFDKVQVFINSIEGTPENPTWAGSSTQYKFDVSRVSELTVHLFIRNPAAVPGSGRSQDIFLGVVRLTPRFNTNESSKDTTSGKNSETAQGFHGVGWFNLQHGTGKLQIGVKFVENQANKLSIDEFELLKVVGKGSFGKVMQVRKKDTNRIYALKTIRKAKIISRSEVTHTLAERSVLAQINNPFIVPLKFTFQSPEKLYFVLAFVNGGELFHHLTNERRFDVNRARFYTAELLCALECLHGFNVIYRDLKPENILLDYQGHIALCDFGLCKLEMKDEDRTNTFCGTPEYLAPELLLGQGYNKTVDWWTLGVLLYEMLTGLPPFYNEGTNEMYRKILSEPMSFPGNDVVPPAAKDLLTKLLNRNPAERLGANGSAEIKGHTFFHAIDWRKLLERKYEPTFKPNVANALDTTNFDPEFTTEAPQDSFVEDPALSQAMQDQFAGFSYNRPVAGLNDVGGSITGPSFMNGSENQR
ncbi:Serine/threonine-protein kinase [Metarhizium anisopliae BRIP 53293]|uniref:non-specific serine/threonine protein kinase n=1 Tax=Metarhizium anisopliae BRIP 53293 TaxID=1291518 RepID=A0A0D9PFJ2_METAN|nr:Serine/threonine-protein kinase [Metarhizium anisopliae BRIP 53293]KJK87671.1 Serine/threonine-protein kinase [Metarhizium anisopliae BRIP 53284]